ncbi:MAG: phenylacetic acid degradation b [Gemmatimonadota bacterium]|nr:phenylacetic acid degradation b [Gemmatimonadota bacterium]
MGHLSGESLYEVFARQKREDRLEHVGAVSAPNAELARVYAWKTYDEATWFEMVVAPRHAFHPVNRDEAPFTLHAAGAA